jgi:hypothetical protein
MGHAVKWALLQACVEFVGVTFLVKYLGRERKIGWGISMIVASTVAIIKLYGRG